MLEVSVPSSGDRFGLNTTDKPSASAAWNDARRLASLSVLSGSAMTVLLVPVLVQMRTVSSIEFDPSAAIV
jgi:hypothetical protein